jgi:hypothetical protein
MLSDLYNVYNFVEVSCERMINAICSWFGSLMWTLD